MADRLTYKEERTWGWFERFSLNEPVTVKILNIKDGHFTSLQRHENREEFWHILSGNLSIIINDTVWNAVAGDQFTVPVGAKHQLKAVGSDAKVLEISRGNFDENDITRYPNN
ncbi:MAG: phosphomannose isomerase type II C-terminal cupin domain [bacterium]